MNITLNNKICVENKNNESIFDSLRNNGFVLNHSCLSARCRSCLSTLNRGSISKIKSDNILDDNDSKNNLILACNSVPNTDIEITCDYTLEENLHKEQILPAKIMLIEKYCENYLRVDLRLPPGRSLSYNPGQYVNINVGSIERSYSIANVYSKDNFLSFFIKNYQDGEMSKYFFNSAKIDDLVRIKGPFGTFFLKDNSKKIIFLATGTGIAPVKSIIENMKLNKINFDEINLFWGMRHCKDFFLDLNEELKSKINYYKVLSQPKEKNYPYTGYVQNIALKIIKDFSGYDVYACGSNMMINESLDLFKRNMLSEERFFSDAFVESK